MKKLILIALLSLPLMTQAQDHPQMTEQQMQAMMQNAQKMQTCMQNIDQNEMLAFEQKGKQMESEIKTLCAEGDREQAQERAMGFAQEVSNSNALQEMKKCAQLMQGMMPDLSQMMQQHVNELSEKHVCDS